MENKSVLNNFDNSTLDNEVNLLELFGILWNGKKILLAFILSASFLSVFISLSLSDVYKSEALLAPVASDNSNSNNPLGQLSGLADMAGMNLSNNKINKTTMGMEVLKSRKFYNNLVEKYEILVPLMATKDWNKSQNALIYDANIYDISKDLWLKKPSVQEGYEEFNKIFNISQNENGVINISVEHHSPFIAKQWLDWIIVEINNTSRNDDITQAERSVSYLNEQLLSTQLSEIREGLNDLVKTQVETIMLAKVTPEYLFRIIDPPFVPEEKFKPSRALICILGFILGGIIGSLCVIIKHFIFKEDAKN